MRTLTLTLLALSGFAQNASLRGRVLDSTGAPIAQATIRIVLRDGSIERTAQSAGDGRYELNNLLAGDYLAQAETRDLLSSAAQLVTVTDGGTAQLDLTLAVRSLTERITVTAENSPQTLDQAGKTIDLIDSRQIANRQLFQIVDALRLTPGVRVQQLGGPGALSRVMMRGLRVPDTSIVIDGYRFRDVAAVQGDASSFLGDLLVLNSDRVEVMRGTGSALYGTNATGGVVQVITDPGGGPTHGEISVDGGGLGLARGLAKISGAAGQDQRFRYSGGTALLNVSNGVDGYDPIHNISGQGWAQYSIRPGSTISGRFFGNRGMGMLNNSPSAITSNLPPTGPVPAIPNVTFIPATNDPDHRRESDFISSLVSFNQRLGSQANLRLGYGAMLSNRADINGPAGAGFQSPYRTVSEFNGRIDTVQARVDWTPLRSNAITAGYEWEREFYANPSFDENPDPSSRVNTDTRAVQRSSAIFVQDQMRFFRERLFVSLGGRYQHFQLDQPVFTGGAPAYNGAVPTTPPDAWTGDASVAWLNPGTGTKFRAHAGNAYRVPSLYERFGSYFFLGSFTAMGDPRLRPERSLGVDGGIDQYFASNRLRLSATYFYTRLQEVIAYGNLSNDPFGRFSGYVNVGGGLARGVELSGEARPWLGMTMQASYTYTNADERQSIMTDGSLRGIRYYPNALTFLAMQQIGKRTNVTFDFLGASDYISGSFFVGGGSRPYLFPGPRRANIAASYTLPLNDRASVMFFTRVENAFNQLYFEDGFQTPKAWAIGGIKCMF